MKRTSWTWLDKELIHRMRNEHKTECERIKCSLGFFFSVTHPLAWCDQAFKLIAAVFKIIIFRNIENFILFNVTYRQFSKVH